LPSHKQRSLFFAGRTNVKKRTKVLPKPWPPDHASRKVEGLCAIHKANVTIALSVSDGDANRIERNRLSVVVVAHASASMPSCAPAIMAACMANGGSGHADTMNSCPEWSASVGDLRDHAVRLMNRRDWHCLC
jgi:hypothetical protein